MAFTGITATEAEIDQAAGANVNSAFTDTMKTQSLLQAESTLNDFARKNYSDEFTTLDVDVKSAVTAVTASLVAIDYINYDMDSIGRSTAESRVNVLRDKALRGMGILKDKNVQTFATGV